MTDVLNFQEEKIAEFFYVPQMDNFKLGIMGCVYMSGGIAFI